MCGHAWAGACVPQQVLRVGARRKALPTPAAPQGTTTNGDYLLPFKTGAFLAGQPVQPVILRYGKVGLGGAMARDNWVWVVGCMV